MKPESERNALEHKWRLGFGLLLLLLVLNAGIALFNTQRLLRNTSSVNHTYQVLRTLEAVFSSMQDAETGMRGYVITGEEAFLEPFSKAVRRIAPDLDRLRFLTRDNPARAKQTVILEAQVKRKLATLRAGIAIFRRSGFEAAQSFTRTGSVKRQMDAIRRTGAQIEAAESELLKQRGAESSQSAQGAIWTFWVATPANLALLGFVYFLFARDMTKRKSVERSLRDATELAEAANRSKSEFISSVSHELRTPLNAIIGFSKLMLNPRVGPLNEDQTEYTQDIVQSSEHLLQLINDILDISKIEAGKMTLDPAPFDLAELLHSSLGIVREKAKQENLSLSTDLAPEITEMAMIVADRRKIKQVLYNLLSNAVKFTPAGGSVTVRARAARPDEFIPEVSNLPTVASANGHRSDSKKISKIDAASTARRNGTPLEGTAKTSRFDIAPLLLERSPGVIISVSDTGIGIPLESQVRVFGAFEQVDSSYARRQEGTGLGLALTKRMVELHGGKLWLESEEGRGSTFFFSLPLRAQEPTPEPKTQANDHNGLTTEPVARAETKQTIAA